MIDLLNSVDNVAGALVLLDLAQCSRGYCKVFVAGNQEIINIAATDGDYSLHLHLVFYHDYRIYCAETCYDWISPIAFSLFFWR